MWITVGRNNRKALMPSKGFLFQAVTKNYKNERKGENQLASRSCQNKAELVVTGRVEAGIGIGHKAPSVERDGTQR